VTTPDPNSGVLPTGALPGWFRLIWICLAPLGFTFAGRIAWEKTLWTWTRGPQSVGFSLIHIHPGFFFLGLLDCGLLVLWLVPALVYFILRRRNILRFSDLVMVFFSILSAAAILLPDTFFAASR
jgi:hypothetical protein